ncbi:hypothetical protein BJX70DRAFT_367579 [Aspergillus crustosus]
MPLNNADTHLSAHEEEDTSIRPPASLASEPIIPNTANAYSFDSDTDSDRETDAGAAAEPGDDSETYTILNNYPSSSSPDYYTLLNLPRDPPPSDAAIRSAYRTLTLSFHPDKQPTELQDAAKRHFERIVEAYETLIDPHKRVVYDLLGEEGVRREWGRDGVMGTRTGAGAGRGAGKESGRGEGQSVGVKAMQPGEFKRWFLGVMKRRERAVVNGLVRSKGTMALGINASNMISVDEGLGEVYLHVPKPKLSSYAVRYSFVTPFPTIRSVLGEYEKEDIDDEDEKGEAKKEEEEGESEESEEPELEIYGGVSGKVQHFFNKMEIELEDGETEILQVPLPLVLSTQNLTLGASTSRVFNDPNPKGILSRWPFSYLQGSIASVDATLLPATTVQANVAKSFVLIPGTRPFNIVFGSIFRRSIFESLPSLSLQLTKGLGERTIAFCNWQSGYLGWPMLIQTLLQPIVELGPEFIIEGQELSQLQVGIASQASLHTPDAAAEEEDIPDSGDADEEYEQIRAKKREEDKAAVAWQLAVMSSPATNGIIFKYSRNIFSGKPATDVALSQWSSEKHYSIPAAKEPRSIRLEVAGTVEMDMSLSWAVSGSRHISELTSIGFGVGLQSRGLVMTFSWSRLGQRIKLPIAVCPVEAVNADSAALAVLLPWLTYCAVEFGLIRPRDRRNRRRVVARRQKQLKKQVPKKRLESAQAIELMADQVRRRQEKENNRGGLVITKAEYGHYSSSKKYGSTSKEPEVADVTIPVAALVDHGQLNISKSTAQFHILGFYDPAPLQPKILKIWYQYHGKDHYIEVGDTQGVTCPMRSHLLVA